MPKKKGGEKMITANYNQFYKAFNLFPTGKKCFEKLSQKNSVWNKHTINPDSFAFDVQTENLVTEQVPIRVSEKAKAKLVEKLRKGTLQQKDMNLLALMGTLVGIK